MLFVAIVNICILALFFLLGLLFARGKGAGLIAGYNTMSAREKEKYDKKESGLNKIGIRIIVLLHILIESGHCSLHEGLQEEESYTQSEQAEEPPSDETQIQAEKASLVSPHHICRQPERLS